MHREAAGSADLHLFQEVSTLGQQFTHTLLLRQGVSGIKPMLPASTPRPHQPFGLRGPVPAFLHALIHVHDVHHIHAGWSTSMVPATF
jgi:hypothetical protein